MLTVEDKKELWYKEHSCFGCHSMMTNTMAKYCDSCEFEAGLSEHGKRRFITPPPIQEWELR